VAAGPFRFVVPELASFDWAAALIALAAAIALVAFKVNMIAVLAAAAVAGMVFALLA
jgi:chromate transporter